LRTGYRSVEAPIASGTPRLERALVGARFAFNIMEMPRARSGGAATTSKWALHDSSCQTNQSDMSSSEVDRIASALVERIVGGRWAPGVRLPAETELAAELGCGRSTVREALGRLASQGLIASRRGSGARVLEWKRDGSPALLPAYLAFGTAPSEARTLVRELLRLRSVLAREAVRLAATYAEADALREVEAALERACAVSDPSEHALAELELFRALVLSSRVWPAVWFTNAFYKPMREMHAELAPLAGGPPADFEPAMRELVELVRRRDVDSALGHLDAWLERVDRALSARIEATLGPATVSPAPGAATGARVARGATEHGAPNPTRKPSPTASRAARSRRNP
jgi:GntR family transcriptional regulator, transcriptional repressor for pyruvate dehydrogenase complex